MSASSTKLIASSIAVTALSGPGVGAGVIFSGLLLATARCPDQRQQLFVLAILGFALTEALGLFGLMMSFIYLFAY